MRLNVKLPGQPSKEAPHLTRFQTELPPHWQGTTLFGLSVEPSDTVAALKAKVAGAWQEGSVCMHAGRGASAVKGGGAARKGSLLLPASTETVTSRVTPRLGALAPCQRRHQQQCR